MAERLLAVPRSESPQLAADFAAVHELPKPVLVEFVDRLRLEASSATLGAVPELLGRRLRRAGFHDASVADARAALVGWFYGRVVESLASRCGSRIRQDEFRFALADIRDRFPRGALPVRRADAEVGEADYAGLRQAVFVRQLALVGVSEDAERRAIRDYLRAVRERTAWVDRGEILPDELGAFERELKERWEPLHERCRVDALGADEAACRSIGFRHFLQVQSLTVQLSPRWPAFAYLSRGSYQRLADLRRLGWHPRRAALLEMHVPSTAIARDLGGSRGTGETPRGHAEVGAPQRRGGRQRPAPSGPATVASSGRGRSSRTADD